MIKLINPPSHFLTDERVFPSLGILKVAASLVKHGFNTSCIDLAGVYNWHKILSEELQDVVAVGITATTPQVPEVIKICNFIIQKFPDIKIILGGPHVTMSYASIKNGSERAAESFNHIKKLVDTIVVGYGELAIIKAISSPEKIIDSEVDEEVKFTNDVYREYLYPDRSIIDLESYRYTIDGQKSTSLICQLGCPFNCSFCGGRLTNTYRRVRQRPVESIIHEIDTLVAKGYKGFMFYDDEININPTRFNSLLEELIKYQHDNKIELSLRGFTRSDLLTPTQAALMSKAGFKWLLVGFESGSDRILTNMNKKCTVEQNTNVFNLARENNLKVKALMSIGHPGESLDTIEETKNWILKVKPDETDFTIITLYPGSPYYDNSVFINGRWTYMAENGDVLYSNDMDYINEECYYKSKEDEYVCNVSTAYLNENELIEMRNKLENETK